MKNWKLKSLILTTVIISLISLLQLSYAGTRTVLGEQGTITGDLQISGKLSIDEELHITGNNSCVRLEDDSGNVSVIKTGNSQLTLDADPDNAVASTDIVFKMDGSEVGRFWQGGNFEIKEQIKVIGGSPGSGKVLTSDADGLAAWGVLINDQASSNYFDIGTMRIQWGREVSTDDDDQTVTFPVAFDAMPAVTAQTEITTGSAAGWGGATNDVTTTNFKFNRDDTIANSTHNPYIAWMAIGLKP